MTDKLQELEARIESIAKSISGLQADVAEIREQIGEQADYPLRAQSMLKTVNDMFAAVQAGK